MQIIKHLKKNNINVVSHIGVTPQKYKNFKKIKSVGKTDYEKKNLINLAIELEKAGSSIIVLECIDEKLAKDISIRLRIPTIGIGASSYCDGQVLVINDILNSKNNIKLPRFVKSYSDINSMIEKSVKNFCHDVTNKKFPKKRHTY